MRLARLKVINQKEDVVLNPNHVVDIWLDDDGDFILHTIRDDDGWVLDMPLQEAIDELNAAMSYNRYEEAALQGANSRLDWGSIRGQIDAAGKKNKKPR